MISQICPLALLISLEPITLRKNPLNSINQPFLKGVSFKSTFDLAFSVYKTPQGGFELSYNVNRVDEGSSTFPMVLEEFTDNLQNQKTKNFVNYPMRIFNDFRKGILLFENRPYDIPEFLNIVKEWKISLKDIELR